ncbi:MAG: MOSC domain-containing protein [Pseudomonadota bacterium]
MITHLYRYPVKGLSPETLGSMPLAAGEGLPGDRVFAIARKPGHFDPDAPAAEPKTKFLMLMRDEALASLNTRLEGNRLIVERNGNIVLDVNIDGETSDIEEFFSDYLGDETLAPRLVSAAGHKFTDISVVSPEKMRAVSLINLNSVRALEEAIGQAVDPLRFRGNIYFSGLPAWSEFDWMEKDIHIGHAKAKVVMRTRRCAATQVNPSTAQRDLDIPKLIKQHFGHMDMGVYAEIIADGDAENGDTIGLSIASS